MGRIELGIEESFKKGWEGFKLNWQVFVGLGVISIAANSIVRFLRGGFLSNLLQWLIGTYIIVSFIKASFIVLSGAVVSWDVLKNDKNIYLKALGLTFILGIINGIAMALFFFPVLFSLALLFPATYMLVSQNTGVIESIKASFDLTKPNLAQCLLFVVLNAILIFVGVLALGIGVLVAIPVVVIATADIYKKLSDGSGAAQ